MVKAKNLTKMEELAELAGVSVSTVSRALAGSNLINEKTRSRIVELAEKHSYQVNEKARNFRLQKTHVISVVMMPDIKSDQHISDMFYLEILGAIADTLSSQEYDLLLAHAPDRGVKDILDSRVFRQCDGIIIIGQGLQHEMLNDIARQGKPMVVWGASLPDAVYCTVGADNELGGYLATKHLLNLGRKRVAFLGDVSLPEPQHRFEGYQRAMSEKGVELDPGLHIHVGFGMGRAHEVIGDLLQRNVDFDAMFCCSDLIAISAMGALAESGINIPDEVAIVGYDDIVLASYSSPPLTTVRQNISQGGRIIVQKLMSQINGDKIGNSVLKTELIVRRSSGAW